MARAWQRWHRLGGRVRPVLGDTCLVSLQDEASTLRKEGRAMSGHGQRSEGLGVGGEIDVGDERQVAADRAREGAEPARASFERQHDPARVLALSDGVFAIIITLLVLEVHVPELTQGQSLAEALEELRPSLVAFVISFILAGIQWVGHRDLFGLIRRTDRGLVWLNTLYLLPLCLLPFGAGLLGRYDQERWRCGSMACSWSPSRSCGWSSGCMPPTAPSCCGSGLMIGNAVPGLPWPCSRGSFICSPS